MHGERERVTLEDAMGMLPAKDRIHTFRCGSGILVGADWDRADLFEYMDKHGVELSGPQATASNHALALVDEHGALFIETREPENK